MELRSFWPAPTSPPTPSPVWHHPPPYLPLSSSPLPTYPLPSASHHPIPSVRPLTACPPLAPDPNAMDLSAFQRAPINQISDAKQARWVQRNLCFCCIQAGHPLMFEWVPKPPGPPTTPIFLPDSQTPARNQLSPRQPQRQQPCPTL
ncbi:uncharacterized protein VP01_6221g1 [Puccinia sorghi]|uniref:Uncharacterized protein n=1 Tax=Puccinia sorghi TaxID=27349 RepID=A0A0L6UHD6_9BASI|nr:uncharacterized protein VP01_6221g1 [Puccinia sorghi]